MMSPKWATYWFTRRLRLIESFHNIVPTRVGGPGDVNRPMSSSIDNKCNVASLVQPMQSIRLRCLSRDAQHPGDMSQFSSILHGDGAFALKFKKQSKAKLLHLSRTYIPLFDWDVQCRWLLLGRAQGIPPPLTCQTYLIILFTSSCLFALFLSMSDTVYEVLQSQSDVGEAGRERPILSL